MSATDYRKNSDRVKPSSPLHSPPLKRANTADVIRNKLNNIGSAVHKQLKVHSESFDDFLAFGESKLDMSRVARVALLFKQTEKIHEETLSKSFATRFKEEFVLPLLMSEIYSNILLLSGLYSSVQYVFQIYAEGQGSDKEALLDNFFIAEVVIASILSFNLALGSYFAEDCSEYWLEYYVIVDMISIVPTFMILFFFPNDVQFKEGMNFVDSINYGIYALATTRILRTVRIHQKIDHIADLVKRWAWHRIMTVVIILVFVSALLKYFEDHNQEFPMHEWLYFIFGIFTTIGQSERYVHTSWGKISVVVSIIVFAIVLVPLWINEFFEIARFSNKYQRQRYRPHGRNSRHVIVCGNLDSLDPVKFFAELFHENHDSSGLEVVLLQSVPPSDSIHRILYQASYFFRIQYLQGSPLCNNDLIRAKASQAQAILFITNKFTGEPSKEDARTIMQIYSVRRHLDSLDITDTFLCAQVMLPENATKLNSEQGLKNSTICLNKMRMGVIAKSCIYPGTSTLLFNLLNSFAYDEPSHEGDKFKSSKKDCDKRVNNGTLQSDMTTFEAYDDEEDTFMDWDAEYKLGAGWEIYSTEIAARFSGYPFLDIARVFYDRLGVVLFALKVKDLKGRKGTKLMLNPVDYVIPSRLDCTVEGFVIAEDNSSADLSFTPKAADSTRRGSQVGSFVSAISKSVEKGKNFIRRRTGTLDTGDGRKKSPYESNIGGSGQNNISQSRKKLIRQNSEDSILSPQERRQKRKNEAFYSNFYCAKQTIDLKYVTVKRNLLDEFPLVHSHIIVAGKSLNNLVDFILPLREKRKGILKHIVILHPCEIPCDVWEQVSIFEGVFFVRGSPVSERDLQRVGVFRASQFVLLAGQDDRSRYYNNGVDNAQSSHREQDGLEDADAIISYQMIRRMNEDLNIVIEMVCPENTAYLEECAENVTDYVTTPLFASGSLFTAAVLDTFVCQAFYNPHIISVIDQLISPTQEVQKSAGWELISASINRSSKNNTKSSCMYQIPLPKSMVGKSYGRLFHYLGENGILAIGLFRGVDESSLNSMPYVFTNPPKVTRLYDCDKVFVLSQNELTSAGILTREDMEKDEVSKFAAACQRHDPDISQENHLSSPAKESSVTGGGNVKHVQDGEEHFVSSEVASEVSKEVAKQCEQNSEILKMTESIAKSMEKISEDVRSVSQKQEYILKYIPNNNSRVAETQNQQKAADITTKLNDMMQVMSVQLRSITEKQMDVEKLQRELKTNVAGSPSRKPAYTLNPIKGPPVHLVDHD